MPRPDSTARLPHCGSRRWCDGEYGARFPLSAIKGGDAATNAGLLAISMLSMTDERLANELQEYRDDLKQKVDESNAKLV